MEQFKKDQLEKLMAGAKEANTHCIAGTNRMNGFIRGLTAAIEIMNADSEEQAMQIAAKYRARMASYTGTLPREWQAGTAVPDENWIVK